MAIQARSKGTNKKRARRRAQAGSAAPLTTAEREPDEVQPTHNEPAYVRAQLATACDQVAVALMAAEQSNDLEMVELIVPVLSTLWSTRMQLNSLGGAQ